MSKIAYKTPITGTGIFTIESPATNTNRTLTLPDAGGQIHTSESVNDHVSMPTVAGDPIVESGSNTDGEWTRWADGTQICHGTASGLDATEAVGSIFKTPYFTAWVFPAVFIADPKCVVNVGHSNRWGSAGPMTPTYSYVKLLSAVSSTDGVADVIAIGRWK